MKQTHEGGIIFLNSTAYFEAMETTKRFLPLRLLRASTLRPAFVCIRLRNPWVRFLLTLLGWYVLFAMIKPFSKKLKNHTFASVSR